MKPIVEGRSDSGTRSRLPEASPKAWLEAYFSRACPQDDVSSTRQTPSNYQIPAPGSQIPASRSQILYPGLTRLGGGVWESVWPPKRGLGTPLKTYLLCLFWSGRATVRTVTTNWSTDPASGPPSTRSSQDDVSSTRQTPSNYYYYYYYYY